MAGRRPRRAARAAVIAAVLVAIAAPAVMAGPAAMAAPAEAVPASLRAAQPAAGSFPQIPARTAELANATTGRRLWSRGLSRRSPIGSITKVMTALVVITGGRLQRRIRISRAAVRYVRSHHGSSAALRAGDVLTARQLLEGMLLPSGCDAAFALATAYGPGRPAFVRIMNRTARRLGLTGTHFANFDGLPWPTEFATYSTARDLVRLGEAAMRSAVFRGIVGQRSYGIAASPLHGGYFWRSTNLLLGSYRGAAGIKTGSTAAAGYCLLFAARRGRTSLIGVVLDSGTSPGARFTAAKRLLKWGFRGAAGGR